MFETLVFLLMTKCLLYTLVALIPQGLQDGCSMSATLSISYAGWSRGVWVALVVKNPLANAWDIRDLGLIPGLGRSPGRGNGNPLQYSCLENSMDRGAWWPTVLRVTKSWTWLKWLSTRDVLVFPVWIYNLLSVGTFCLLATPLPYCW